MGYLYGLAISTYFSTPELNKRFEIFKQSINSLLNLPVTYPIYIVDDGSPYSYHLDYVKKIDINKKISIFKRLSNGGISRVKNTSIRLLKEIGCKYIFLADDDIEYLKKDVYEYYIKVATECEVKHLCFYVDRDNGCIEKHKKGNLLKTPLLNGCFLMVEDNIVDDVGFYKIFEYPYGHEHTNFTLRIKDKGYIPYFCDAPESHHFIRLIPESGSSPSMSVDHEKVKKLWPIASSSRGYEPLEE